MDSGFASALDDLLPVVAQYRDQAETERKPANELCETFRSSELMGMSVASAYGGLGTSLPDMLRGLETVAYSDAAASWLLWNISLVGLYARYMPAELRATLFADAKPVLAHSTIPAGTIDVQGDEVIVNGRWPLVSGCPAADWVILTGNKTIGGEACTDDAGQPVSCLVALPAEKIEVLDTWHSSGLRGTGSHDVVVTAQTAPESHTFSMTNPARSHPTDFLPVFGSVSALFASQLLGLGKTVIEHSQARMSDTPGLNSRPECQIAIARHYASLEAASTLLYVKAEAVWAHAENKTESSKDAIADLYASTFVVIDAVKQCVDELHALGGTSALYTSSPIEKPARDLHAMLRHIVAQPIMQADVGRYQLGLEPEWPLFFV